MLLALVELSLDVLGRFVPLCFQFSGILLIIFVISQVVTFYMAESGVDSAQQLANTTPSTTTSSSKNSKSRKGAIKPFITSSDELLWDMSFGDDDYSIGEDIEMDDGGLPSPWVTGWSVAARARKRAAA